MSTHPSLNLITDADPNKTCSSCLSTNLTKRGFSLTKTTKKQRHQCGDCGSWSLGSSERIKKYKDDSEDD